MYKLLDLDSNTQYHIAQAKNYLNKKVQVKEIIAMECRKYNYD